MFLVDAHCHLDSLDYETVHKDVDDVLNKAHEMGVTHFLCAGTSLEEFTSMYELVKPLKEVYAACAMHPENVNETNQNWSEDDMKKNLALDKVIALGETGLDYICAPETKDIQKKSFERQIIIAKEMNKPLIIHARGAINDCLDMIRAIDARDIGGQMHCFCEDKEAARKSLDLGYYISFSGILTFKNADLIRETCKYVPLDRMLVETDSPYLAPVPKRGKPNEPAFVSYTAKCVAELKGVSYEEVCNQISKNFSELFKVKL